VKTRGPLRTRLVAVGRRAVVAYLLLIVAGLGYVYATVPRLGPGLTSAPVLALVTATVLLAGVYALAGRVDRPRLELAAAAGQVYALVGVVATLLFPFVDPATGATVRGAIVSTLPLNLMSVGAAVLLPLVALYFVVLYSAFRGPVRTEESYS
jgi:cytochrome d ubiquinol oxidase subunit II